MQIITDKEGNKYRRNVAEVDARLSGKGIHRVEELMQCRDCPARENCRAINLAHLCMPIVPGKQVFFNLTKID